MNYQAFEFVGYLYKNKDTKYGCELYIKTEWKDEEEKWPQRILVNVNKHNSSKIDKSIRPGDKVRVKIIPTLAEGVSEKTNRAYAINKLNLQSIEVLERSGDRENEDGESASTQQEEMPF